MPIYVQKNIVNREKTGIALKKARALNFIVCFSYEIALSGSKRMGECVVVVEKGTEMHRKN